MIKKAVLPLLAAPFLMVFSVLSLAQTENSRTISAAYSHLRELSDNSDKFVFACALSGNSPIADVPPGAAITGISDSGRRAYWATNCSVYPRSRYNGPNPFVGRVDFPAPFTDEQCNAMYGGTGTKTITFEQSSGSVAAGGACSVKGNGVTVCFSDRCSSDWVGESTGSPIDFDADISQQSAPSDTPLSPPSYLTSLPGGCADNSNCVQIGDTSYLVDWDSAPDYFSYVDSNGTTHSKPSSGSGSGGDNGGGNPTDPTDPGGDNGGGDSGGDAGGGDDSGNDDSDDNNGGGGSGGGSTVPDFEFDESGIIEAIRSSGQSNRNSIDALSNDVTREISDQTNDLNAATSAQTEALTNTINSQTSELVTQGDRQTGRVTTAITSQTQSVQNTLDNQTRSLNSTLEGLEKSLVDAFKNITVRFPGGGSGGGSSGGSDGDGEGDGEGEGEGDGIDGLFDSLVDKLASRFTEDLGDGDDLFNSSGMDETLDGVALQEQEHGDEINSLMDEVGDGASSDIAEQITSRLPSLPSGGCVPFQFGPMEISCRPFNIIKSWLTWAIYFYSVISIINTFFRSEQRTA